MSKVNPPSLDNSLDKGLTTPQLKSNDDFSTPSDLYVYVSVT